jgi:acetyltransferase-like isoleucine patch superfamily enzyme
VRDAVKALARAAATVVVLPALASFAIRKSIRGADAAIEASSQALSIVPGRLGDYLRRAFYTRTLQRCATSATIQFGTLLSQVGVEIGEHVYIGPCCQLGLVTIENDVLLATGVHVPSGAMTHGIGDVTQPIREQEGARVRVRIGEGTWVGSAAIILADVGKHCVIGAGAVVTTPIPDYAIAAGVPAKVIRDRRDASARRA